MMFVGYANCESDSIRMWDLVTARVIMKRDVIWLKKMFFKRDSPDVIELDTLADLENDETPTEADNQPEKPGGRVTWHSSVATPQESNRVTRSGCIIKTPDRLMYAPAVELRYLGEMVELDHKELAGLYMFLQIMELALIGAGTGGSINHTSELMVLNYKKAMQSPNAGEWLKETDKEKVQFDKYNALMPVKQDLLPKGAKVLTTMWAMNIKSMGEADAGLIPGGMSK